MRIDAPWRHLAIDDALFDRARPRPDVLIREQRHRRHLPRTMAALTGSLEDWRYVFREGDRGWRRPRRRLTAERNRGDDDEETRGSNDPNHTVLPIVVGRWSTRRQ